MPSRPAALADGRVLIVAHEANARRFAERLWGAPALGCVVASTETAEIPGISAAGETPEKRRYTAALDSEILVLGRPVSMPEIPRNPAGPPSPVVITRACVEALGLVPWIVDAGTRIPPRVPRLVLDGQPGKCITTGQALTLSPDFVQMARAAGRLLASRAAWLVLGESVPGGTTTAQAVMEALGIHAQGRVSSSMPGGNHALKTHVVSEALRAAALPGGCPGLRVAQAVGDPMQPAVALMALEASLQVPVVLGGGTQMAAVVALALKLLSEGHAGNAENLAVATTRWVAEDPSADLAGILRGLAYPVPGFAAGLDFGHSALPELRRYEEGLVKEGVGAGAAACAALLVGDLSLETLVPRIEEVTRDLGPR
jgi:uncharacterized protein (TIGR00303 family)